MNRADSQRAFQGTFEAFDEDGNGAIDLEELQLGLSKQDGGNHSFSTVALKDLLDKFDANNNGVLEKDEFIKLMLSTELEDFFADEDNVERGSALDLEAIYKLTPTPEETPTLIKEKIAEFDKTLDKLETAKKTSCMMAQEKCPGLCEDDFKLAFLRCEVFNVELAVNRWAKYWDMRLKHFGPEKAFLPMTSEGAMKGCEKALSSTYVSVAEGVTDPDGRAILLMDFREESGDLSDEDLFKTAFYQYHVALSSELCQKNGVVIFIRCLVNYFDGRNKLWRMFGEFQGVLPVRASAIHFVKPPSFIKVVIKVMKILMGPKLRNRIYVHSGSMAKVLESLSEYGLGSKDMLPDVFEGNLSFSSRAKLTLTC